MLGQLPGAEAYRDVALHSEAITFPGLLIWRPAADLCFASIGHIGEGVKAALAASRPPARHVLLDAGSVNLIDTHRPDALLNAIKGTAKPRRLPSLACAIKVREKMQPEGRSRRGPGELLRALDGWRARLAAEEKLR